MSQRSFSVNCYVKIKTNVIIGTDAYNVFFEVAAKGLNINTQPALAGLLLCHFPLAIFLPVKNDYTSLFPPGKMAIQQILHHGKLCYIVPFPPFYSQVTPTESLLYILDFPLSYTSVMFMADYSWQYFAICEIIKFIP